MGYGRWGWRALSILLHAGETAFTVGELAVTCSLIGTCHRIDMEQCAPGPADRTKVILRVEGDCDKSGSDESEDSGDADPSTPLPHSHVSMRCPARGWIV